MASRLAPKNGPGRQAAAAKLQKPVKPVSLVDEFVTGTASAFLPPEQDTSSGPLLRAKDIKNPLVRSAANVAATNASAVPFFGRAAKRIVEPEPMLDASKGGKAARVAKGMVNEAPNLARSVGEQLIGQTALGRIMPQTAAAGVTGAALSLADTGVPMGTDTRSKQQALQAGYGGFANAMGMKLGGAASELSEVAMNPALTRIGAQLPFDLLSPLGDVATAGLDVRALIDPTHPEHEETLKVAMQGLVAPIVGHVAGGDANTTNLEASDARDMARARQLPVDASVPGRAPRTFNPESQFVDISEEAQMGPERQAWRTGSPFQTGALARDMEAGRNRAPQGPMVNEVPELMSRLDMEEQQRRAQQDAEFEDALRAMNEQEAIKTRANTLGGVPELAAPSPFPGRLPTIDVRGNQYPAPEQRRPAINRWAPYIGEHWRTTPELQALPELGGALRVEPGEPAGGPGYSAEPRFEAEFQGELAKAKAQLPARIRAGIVLPEIGPQPKTRKGKNAPKPEATSNVTPPDSAKGSVAGELKRLAADEEGFVAIPPIVKTWADEAVQAFDDVMAGRRTARQVYNDAGAGLGRQIDAGVDMLKRPLAETKMKGIRQSVNALMPNRGAGSRYAELRARMDGRTAVAAATRRAFEKRLKPLLKKASKAQIDEMVQVFTNPTKVPHLLTREQLTAVGEARILASALQQRMVGAGILSKNGEQMVLDTLGKHLRRFYRRHEDADVPRRLAKMNPGLLDAAAREFMALDPRIRDLATAKLRLEEYLASKDVEIDKRTGAPQPGAGKLALASPFMQRKLENLPALRQLLGEYTGFGERFSKTHADLAAEAVRGEFLRDLATQPDENGRPFSISKQQRDSGQFPEYTEEIKPSIGTVKMYGDLEGRFMRPVHFEALADVADAPPPGVLAQLLGATNKVFNFANTALSPATIGANMVSGAGYHSVLSDSFVLNPNNWGASEIASKGAKQAYKDSYYGRAISMLMDRTSPQAKELFDAGAAAGMYLDEPIDTRGLLTIQQAIEAGHSPFEALKRVIQDFDKLPVMEQAGRFYNGIDLMYRFASVLKRLDKNTAKGMPYDQAMREAVRWTNHFHPDYSKVPTILKKFQKTPIAGPFLSYMFDSPRVAFNALRHNPMKLGLITGALKALEYGIADSDEEREAKDAARMLMADWEQADMTPMAEIDGRLTYVPLGRLNPLAQLMAQMKNPKFSQFLMNSPAMNALKIGVSGVDNRGVKQVPDPDVATEGEKFTAAMKNFGAVHVSPLTPGIGYQAEQIRKAWEGEPNQYGQRNSLGYALMGLTGVRPRTLELDAGYRFRSFGVSNSADGWAAKARTMAESKQTPTSKIEDMIGQLDERIPALSAKADALNKAYVTATKKYPKSVGTAARRNKTAAKKFMHDSIEKMEDARRELKKRLPANHPLRTGEATSP